MAKFKDLKGITIGRLTFIEYEVHEAKGFWTAKCQCGEMQKYRVDYISQMKCIGRTFECFKCKMERKSPTLTDKVFGRLTVIKEVPGKDHHRWWLCKCECGVLKEIPAGRLNPRGNRKATKSCGCLSRKLNSKWVNTTQYRPAHQLKSKNTDSRKAALYHCRNHMVAACYRPEDASYKRHGGLGHKVCDLWRNGAKDFVEWALKNDYNDGDGIFLKDGKTIFSPDNCIIQSKADACKVKNSKFIEWNGTRQSISSWAKKLGCSIACLSVRLKKYKDYGLEKIMDLSWVPGFKRSYGTEHFEKDIVKLYQEGKTFAEISEEIGCCTSTIGRFLKKNKIKTRPAKCRSSL